MGWKQFFSQELIERGEMYAQDKRVTSLVQKADGCFQANVNGGKSIYVANVRVADGAVLGSCSCGQEGFCRHMAALCVCLDERRPGWDTGETEEKTPDDYTRKIIFFDVDAAMKAYSIPPAREEEALSIIKAGRVRRISFYSGYSRYYSDQQLLSGQFSVAPFKQGEAVASITMSRNHVLSIRCSGKFCWRFPEEGQNGKRELCIHQLAALLAMRKLVEDENPGEETNLTGAVLMRGFGGKSALMDETDGSVNKALLEEEKPVQQIHLEPRITLKQKDIYAQFRIGVTRMYAVKNLNELLSAIEQKESLSFGKSLVLDFSRDVFDEASEPIRDFLLRYYKEDDLLSNGRGDKSAWGYEEGQLHLLGMRLDDFFEINKGKTLALSGGMGQTVYLTEADQRAEMNISPKFQDDGSFIGIEANGTVPSFVEGARYLYSYRTGYLFRDDPEKIRSLLPLIQIASNETYSFTIGRKSLRLFFRHVLPKVKASVNVNVEEAQTIEKFLPPEAEFGFWINCDSKAISCEVHITYNDHAYILESSPALGEDFRDTERENEIRNHVISWFPGYNPQYQYFVRMRNQDGDFDFITQGIEEFMELGEVHVSDSFRNIRVRRKWKMKMGISIESDLMTIQILSDEFSKEEVSEILASMVSHKRYHLLRNGEFLAIDNDEMETLMQLLGSENVSLKEFVTGKMHLPAYRALYIDNMLSEHEEISADRDKAFRQLIKNFNTVRDSDFEVPLSLHRVLRNYQVFGFKWVETLMSAGFGGILADDMGLGKTIQVLSALLYDVENRKNAGAPSIVVCPASLVYNWQEEIERFTPQLSHLVIAGNAKDRAESIGTCRDRDVIITSYDLLKRDIAEYEDISFYMAILDEAQFIKNHAAQVTKAVKLIHARHRLALTGTPIENRLSELWSIFDFLMPGFLFPYETFRNEVEIPVMKEGDEEAMDRLRRMASPFILRRLKQDVLKDLPEKTEETRYAILEGEQQRLYDAQVQHLRQMLQGQNDEEFNQGKIVVLSELTKLRQICCDPALLYDNYEGISAKRTLLLQLIQEAIEGGHKILVFSQFTSMLELIRKDLENAEISYYLLTGATPKAERVEMASRFNSDETPVFLISLRAGGTGLNLVGADIVIHCDPWWNQAVMNQATDRAHRIGQKRAVSVFRLIAKDTVEEKILKMQEMKRDMAEGVLGGETGGFAQLTKQELMDLLSVQ